MINYDYECEEDLYNYVALNYPALKKEKKTEVVSFRMIKEERELWFGYPNGCLGCAIIVDSEVVDSCESGDEATLDEQKKFVDENYNAFINNKELLV